MTTIVAYKDGHSETYPDAAPSVNPEEKTITLIDVECGVIGDDIPMEIVNQVLFEV